MFFMGGQQKNRFSQIKDVFHGRMLPKPEMTMAGYAVLIDAMAGEYAIILRRLLLRIGMVLYKIEV